MRHPSRSASIPLPPREDEVASASGDRPKRARASALGPGDVVDGRFEVEATAGRGGMGVVYRARDLETGATVALKVLEGGRKERFEREAAILAGLAHPAIVRYVGHGTHAEQSYLAMEWLRGDSLSKRLRTTGVTVGETVEVGLTVAEALAEAHANGIVHRDIKPSNLVFVDRSLIASSATRRVKLLDFGLAHRAEADALTRPGAMVGTPGYLAPEQARGSGIVDARADVFSLGCVLFECLTGVSLFSTGHPAALLARLLFEDAKRVRDLRPEVPEELSAIVERMLRRDPRERYADGREVAKALRGFDLDLARAVVNTVARRAVLTRREIVSMSVVLVALGSHPTRVEKEELAAIGATFGATLDVKDDGTIAYVVMSTAATDQAVRASRLSLRVASSFTRASVAVATAMGSLDETRVKGDALVRARATIDSVRRIDAARIRVDETTDRLLPSRFVRKAIPGAMVLAGERRIDTSPRKIAGRRTPCVGRERELRLIGNLVDASIAEGVSAALLVTGGAGVGKSRLGFELESRIPRAAAMWTGRSDPMRSSASYGLIGNALRRVFGFSRGEPPTERRRKVYERVLETVSFDEAPRVAHFLADLAGVPLQTCETRVRGTRVVSEEDRRAAFLEFLDAECAVRPLVLVLEDLQWADLGSVRLVHAALRRLRDRPLVVIGLARPDVHTFFPRLFEDCALHEVRIGALPPKSARRIAEAVLAEDDGRIDEIVARAEGSPRLLEALLEDELAGQKGAPSGTVMALAHARFAAFDVEARQILRAASILGTGIDERSVSRLLGAALAPDVVRTWLERLAKVGALTLVEGAYELRDGLLREAAYATLTEGDRRFGQEVARAAQVGTPASEPLAPVATGVRKVDPSAGEDTIEDAPPAFDVGLG